MNVDRVATLREEPNGSHHTLDVLQRAKDDCRRGISQDFLNLNIAFLRRAIHQEDIDIHPIDKGKGPDLAPSFDFAPEQ